MNKTYALVVCISSAMAGGAAAQDTLAPVVAVGQRGGGYDYFAIPNPHYGFFGGRWESGEQETFYSFTPPTPVRVVEKCNLLDATQPQGCDPNMAAYLSPSMVLPAPNSSTFCWFGCNTSVSSNFGSLAGGVYFGQTPFIFTRLQVLSQQLNDCYGSSFNNPAACEQSYISQIDSSCEQLENFYIFDFMGNVETAGAEYRQGQCRYSSSFERQDIGAAMIAREQDNSFFEATSSISVGYNLGPFSITFLELSHTWDTTPGFNRSLVAARIFENCKNWAEQAYANGCFNEV